MDSDTLARIEAAARACPSGHELDGPDGWYTDDDWATFTPACREDMAYIATMDPATTLALVEYVRRLERAVEKARGLFPGVRCEQGGPPHLQ